MDSREIAVAIWGLALTVAIAFVGWFFRTPKETQTELAMRVDELEDKHHALDKDFATFAAQLRGEIRHLSGAIERLASIIDGKGLKVSGEHRRAE